MPKLFVDELIAQLNNPEKFIYEAEKAYNDEIERLCTYLLQNRQISVLLLAGPSGSGKTTTANILKDKLISRGMNTAVVSLDNFFKNKEDYPLLEDGSYDFESIQTLDVDTIHRCLGEIIENGSSIMPRFDFIAQCRSKTPIQVTTGKDGVVIIEGIHALNPVISEKLDKNGILEVFVSVSTGICSEQGEIISGKQIRLLRRTIRDNLYRGFKVRDTLRVWQSVLAGEDLYLYPYKHLADTKINTFHGYEVFVYNDYLRRNMTDLPTSDESGYADVFAQLKALPVLAEQLVPKTSLLREFLPGGVYEDIYKHG